MIAHLAEVVERVLDVLGPPRELRDGSMHHNGGHCLDGRVYTLMCENGLWHWKLHNG